MFTWILSSFGSAAATFALGLIKAALARKDISDKIKGEIANEMLVTANAALAWKADAVARPDGGAGLRVRPDAGSLGLPGDNPHP